MKPGRELDALVAEKVMGGRRIVCGGWKVQYNTETSEYKQEQVPVDVTPRYSTDISAAWEVVEHFKSLGKELEIVSLSGSDEQQWSVSNCNCESMFHGGWEGTGVGEITVFSDTAPHAICLAALKAVGVEL